MNTIGKKGKRDNVWIMQEQLFAKGIIMSYQRRLEIAACFLMSLMMLVTGSTFVLAPNQTTFVMLASAGLTVAPLALAFFSFISAMGYLTLIDPYLSAVSPRVIRTVYLTLSLPLVIYIVALSTTMIARGLFSLTSLSYISLSLVILLIAFAVYNRRSLVVETAGALVLSVLMFSLMLSFPSHPPVALLDVGLHGWGFSVLSLLGGVGFLTLFYPRVRALNSSYKHLWIAISALPVGLYGLLQLRYSWMHYHPGLLIGMLLMTLYFQIVLFGVAIYRPRSDEARRGDE